MRFKRRYGDRLLKLADREARGEELVLVLAGRGEELAIPERPDIVLPGFVTDGLKHQLVENAAAVVVPSRFESLSLVLLEAWTLGRRRWSMPLRGDQRTRRAIRRCASYDGP